ncbi:hypothetical protein [Bacteroides sp. 519]|uniref:hypothetical protein n=1 Tax=Bacteroides sp. 519 TaxID=2302937 RepID=UPI0013D54C30|nr:hypothetical protein [Bacteroides sp. 519]NDV60346.1 hypothetical protein [Bacteroides sp. 519]
MKKQFMNALLCGAMIFSAGTYTSCSYDDELKSRLTVVEGKIAELKEQLSKALTTGASITKATQINGVWTLELSDGQKITIAGGGANITVTDEGDKMVITVDGTRYELPKGGAVSSLVYSPEYADGIVYIGNAGATIKLLATPVVSEDALKNATFDIAEAHELKTRAGSDLFEINGDVTLDGDLLAVPVKAIETVEPGKSYAVSILMNINGTAISSNYFTVKVSDDFSVEVPEEIGGFEVKSEYNYKALAEGFSEITINGAALLKVTNFKDLFTTLPENAEFTVARKGQQPGGDAQEKWDLLSTSLKKDGSWAFSDRPGTSFNSNEERAGFLVNITASGVVKAKIYVIINDELADLNFENALPAGPEAEWGGREFSLDLGAQEVDIQKSIANYEEFFPIIHGATDFFEKWGSALVTLEDEGDVLWNDGEKLTLGSVGSEYAAGSKGIYFFCRGFAIYVPEALATDGKYKDENGKEYSGAEGYGYDHWGAQGVDMNNQFMLNEGRDWGFDITQDGKIKVPASYTGYGLRLGIGACYEYAYGVKKIGGGDQFGLYFFNRRLAPEGAKMPAPKE